MATRKDILETFLSELHDSAAGLVSTENIGIINDENLETTPAIVYDANVRPVLYNNASAAPDNIIRDSNGDVLNEVYHEYNEMIFFVHIRADSQLELEDIYEAVHTHFQTWQFYGLKKPSEFHADVKDVEVRQINSSHDPSAEATYRGDTLEVAVEFRRDYETPDGIDVIKDVDITIEGEAFTSNN